jgi:hypothetical protein
MKTLCLAKKFDSLRKSELDVLVSLRRKPGTTVARYGFDT